MCLFPLPLFLELSTKPWLLDLTASLLQAGHSCQREAASNDPMQERPARKNTLYVICPHASCTVQQPRAHTGPIQSAHTRSLSLSLSLFFTRAAAFEALWRTHPWFPFHRARKLTKSNGSVQVVVEAPFAGNLLRALAKRGPQKEKPERRIARKTANRYQGGAKRRFGFVSRLWTLKHG